MKTYIILIPLSKNRDARKQCEGIEATEFKIGGAVQATALDVRVKVIELIDDPTSNISSVLEVEPITDFMDRVNDEQFNSDDYFMSYVYA